MNIVTAAGAGVRASGRVLTWGQRGDLFGENDESESALLSLRGPTSSVFPYDGSLAEVVHSYAPCRRLFTLNVCYKKIMASAEIRYIF